jgi:hypothetical protein
MNNQEPTIDLSMRTPIINNDKEVFTNKRDFINHCLEVMGHQRGVEVKAHKFSKNTTVWEMFYHSQFGSKHIFTSSFVSEQDLWNRAESEALYELGSLNNNRIYDSKHSLEDVITSAKAMGGDASYWQNLLDALMEVTK